MERYSFYYLASTLGTVGRFPFAPATVATLAVAIPVWFFLNLFSLTTFLIITIILTVFGIYVSGRAEKEIGRRDPGEIVIDELAGFLVGMIGVQTSWKAAVLGFFIFRFFDIVKPWPLRLLQERLDGGLAIVMDDIGAGLYTNLCVHISLVLWT